MYRDYTFSRNDTMLVQRVDGTWERVGANFPCLTYKDDTYGKYRAGAWIPKALQNIVWPSEDFANANWTGLGTTVTSDESVSFIQGVNADKIVASGGVGLHRLRYQTNISVTSGLVYTMALFVRARELSQISLEIRDVSEVPISATYVQNVFDLSTPTGDYITSLGDGYYLIKAQFTANATSAAARMWIYLRKAGSNSFSGDGEGLNIIGAQFYQNTVGVSLNPFDYVQSTVSANTRAVTDIRNTSFPELASLQGFIDVELNNSATDKRIMTIGADGNNRLQLTQPVSGGITLVFRTGGVNIWTLSGSALADGRYRISYGAESGNNYLKIDNVLTQRNELTYVPQGSIKVLGRNIAGGNEYTNIGFFNEYTTSGKTEAELLAVSSFTSLTQFMDFKHATFDDQALTTSAITLLQNTEL